MEDRFVALVLKDNAEKKRQILADAEEITILGHTMYSGRVEVPISAEGKALIEGGEFVLNVKLKNYEGQDYHFRGVASTEPLRLNRMVNKKLLRQEYLKAEAYIEYIINGMKLNMLDKLAQKYKEQVRTTQD